MHQTPPLSKFKQAAVHMEGKALQWFQTYMMNRITRDIPSWEEFVRALNDRFGTMLYEDPMSKLVNLKQTSSIQTYLDQFEELLNCVNLHETHGLSYFLRGLKSEIALLVHKFKPSSFSEAIQLARLYEQALSHRTKIHPSLSLINLAIKNPPMFLPITLLQNILTSTRHTLHLTTTDSPHTITSPPQA